MHLFISPLALLCQLSSFLFPILPLCLEGKNQADHIHFFNIILISITSTALCHLFSYFLYFLLIKERNLLLDLNSSSLVPFCFLLLPFSWDKFIFSSSIRCEFLLFPSISSTKVTISSLIS